MKKELWSQVCEALGMPPDSFVMDIVKKAKDLKKINGDLKEACKDFVAFDWEHSNCHWPTMTMWISRFQQAVSKAEGREE